jgi:hypothetical protein
MTSFDLSVLTASLVGGVGVAVIATTALRRHRGRRSAEHARIPGNEGRRIDVVAIDERAARVRERGQDA